MSLAEDARQNILSQIARQEAELAIYEEAITQLTAKQTSLQEAYDEYVKTAESLRGCTSTAQTLREAISGCKAALEV